MARENQDWSYLIRHEFGLHPEFLLRQDNLSYDKASYHQLEEVHNKILQNAEEYYITLGDKQKIRQRKSLNLYLPEATLHGIALAVLVANLPINLQSVDNEMVIEDAPDLDLVELGNSLLMTADIVDLEALEENLDLLSQYTLVLSNNSEEIFVTGVNDLTIQGFIMAFDWLKLDAAHWQQYLFAIYVKDADDNELVRVSCNEFI